MIAKDINAIGFILLCLVLAAFMLVIGYIWNFVLGSIFCGFFLLMGFCVAMFFRDPPRKAGEGIVSPADGRVIIIDTKGKYKRVCVFMNVFNVHVNRAPLAGEVVEVVHHEGKFKAASEKESEDNERVEVTYKTDRGTIKTIQIAGLIARRIVPYVEKGNIVGKGDRIGHIAFGSRVDLYLPSKTKVLVEVGQKVKAGITTIAR